MKKANENGSISRQEAVSMVPPLFMDVLPSHRVRSVRVGVCVRACVRLCVFAHVRVCARVYMVPPLLMDMLPSHRVRSAAVCVCVCVCVCVRPP
jgi:hypothetical protein